METRIQDKIMERLFEENAILRAENAELRATVAKLLKRIAELERRLGMNSQNSSKPPSSDPFGASRPSTGTQQNKPGAKKGHEPHLKTLLPPESVTRRFIIRPEICPNCGGVHFIDTGEKPLVNQFIDVPPIKPDVTEYVRPARRCAACGATVYAPMPSDAPKSWFGPGVLALIAMFTGVLNLSKRKAMLVMNELFRIPISLGGVSNCEEQISASIQTPYDQTLEYVRSQTVAHADETGWRRGNRVKGWLWTLCCSTASAFMVHAKRGHSAAKQLLKEFCGVLVTDRWDGYNTFDGERQICWAHLKRDFQAISEANGRLGALGDVLGYYANRILKLHRRVRDGTLPFQAFQKRMKPLMVDVEDILEDGASGEGPLAGKCREILKHRENLWTFVNREDVPPTNNHAERMVRQGVLWRKMSLGTQSERGAQYVERVLTICATCKLRSINVVEYFRNACYNYRHHLLAPSLFS